MADKEDSNNQPSDQSRPQPDDIGQGPDDIHSLMPGLVLDHSELVPYEGETLHNTLLTHLNLPALHPLVSLIFRLWHQGGTARPL